MRLLVIERVGALPGDRLKAPQIRAPARIERLERPMPLKQKLPEILVGVTDVPLQRVIGGPCGDALGPRQSTDDRADP